MEDYLKKYVTDDGFDIPKLINDDFFLAIKTVFNAGYYISATKLLMSFIDSMAYLEYGDSGSKEFQGWLDSYVDLKNVNVSAGELWEHRNSLLHMTTLNSRKVNAGQVRRLVAYVGITLRPPLPTEDPEAKWFNLLDLIHVVGRGVGKFVESLKADGEKRMSFIRRYDNVLSDVRYERLQLNVDG